MLSYRHAFHAGNFADVLKHSVLIECLNYLKKKTKPCLYADTHAGPGLYSLSSDFAQKNKEHTTGITQIWNTEELPTCLAQYRDCIRSFNPPSASQSAPINYPGSPLIADTCLRTQDRLELCELHPADYKHLLHNLPNSANCHSWKADGFTRTLKQLPPRERRGLILIDPPYELKEDYTRAVDFLIQAHRKFAQGTYALWYPVVTRTRIDLLENRLRQSGIRDIKLFELSITADTDQRGMTGSGMILINPPWTLRETLTPALEFLANHLSPDQQGHYRIETLAAE